MNEKVSISIIHKRSKKKYNLFRITPSLLIIEKYPLNMLQIVSYFAFSFSFSIFKNYSFYIKKSKSIHKQDNIMLLLVSLFFLIFFNMLQIV